MSLRELQKYTEIWFVDFEFRAAPGERQVPICMVALEYKTKSLLRLWEDDLRNTDRPPLSLGPDVLYVAYYASAELQCHLALEWPMPQSILDLFAEFRCRTNGLTLPSGNGLLGASVYFGLPAMEAVEKTEMRDLALRGGPWTQQERLDLLDYCEADVRALERLFEAMLPELDVNRALLRGKYMAAAACIEHQGIPIDVERLNLLREHWGEIQDHLIRDIDKDFGVYEGRTFKMDRWCAWLAANDIPWPRLATGALDMRDSTLKDMARSHPQIGPLRELRYALSQMRLAELAVGSDGRNRCLLSAFRSRTGRNQPSNSRFIFGPAVWLRGLIKPPEGYGLAYIDWSQQEFAIAAALSQDQLMMDAYSSGDPYMRFAIQAGAAPEGATKKDSSQVRDLFKACVLAVQYGMGAESLAVRINKPPVVARELLDLHHKTYRRYWDWSDGVQDHAMLMAKLWTVFGWELRLGRNAANPRSLRNFPMQANGAEMLRLASIMLNDAGIRIVAPVHDALLIEAPLETLDQDVALAQELMCQAGQAVLGGFSLRSDAKVIRYPDRYMDKRGEKMWNTVLSIL